MSGYNIKAECYYGKDNNKVNKVLKEIKTTNGGYLVKDLRYKSIANIIIGLVKDPIFGKEGLHNGYISVQWNSRGYPINKNKGREELRLIIKYEEEDNIQDRG